MLAVNLLIDYYIFRIIKKRFIKGKFISRLYAILSIVVTTGTIVAISMPLSDSENSTFLLINWMLFIYLSVYIPKYIFIIFELISRIPLLFKGYRIKWIGKASALLSALVFISMWWGALFNRYNISVKELTIEINGLPESFEGYRILQFSDFHLGSYGEDTEFVEEVVSCINELKPDIILFTGDIVNRKTDELVPFTSVLSNLMAADGVKAILGNHDYGDYYKWNNETEKKENMNKLYSLFKKMGWRLLLNETDWLVRNNDSIALIGVENIGDPPFPIYGSLSKAYNTLDDDKVKILLSHNPSHWTDSITNHIDKNIALTLSGHTHAMQIEVFGLSPSVFRYKTWGGKYENTKENKTLYVNIGIGTVGLPMRLGATPELTMITLTRKLRINDECSPRSNNWNRE